MIPELAGLASAFEEALGERLVSVAVYGSAVTGDFIPGFSDVDLAVLAWGTPGLGDARALQTAVSRLVLPAGTHLQLGHWISADSEQGPVFVPGQFRVLYGESIPGALIYDEDSLRAAGREWLAGLPALIRQDAQDWSVSIGPDRVRRIRLLATRLKPAIRAALVEQGYPAIETWGLPWGELANRWEVTDPAGAAALREVIGRLPPVAEDEAAIGDTLLAMLWAGIGA